MGKYKSVGDGFDRTFRNDLNDNLNDIDTDIKVVDSRVSNIVASAGNSNTEIVDARGGFPILKDRLDDVKSQLAEKVKSTNIKDIRDNANVFEYSTDGSTWKQVQGGGASGGAVYLVELAKWGIKNDKTDSTNTANGINDAFQWAYDNGYSQVVLPKGEYLIPAGTPITPQNNTCYDFNGSKVYMEPNASEHYEIIHIGSHDSTKKAHHITIANGEFIGDRDTHDFSTFNGTTVTHEWGYCIFAEGHCKFIRIENCVMTKGIGDGFCGSYIYDVWLYPVESNFELGGYSKTTGASVTSTTTIRTKTPYDVSHYRVTNNDGKFMLTGNGYGSKPGITTELFDIYFYGTNGLFISMVENATWYQDITRPDGATTMHFVIKQATSTGIAFEVRAEPRPEFITIENCEISYNRRLGVACTGMRYFYLLNNEIHHNTGWVGGGLDIEDGYQTNQNIYVKGNKFYGHGINDLIVIGTYYVEIENNSFQSNCGGSGRYWSIRGNHFQRSGGSITASDVIFANNVGHDGSYRFGSETQGKSENVNITGNVFRNYQVSIMQSSPYTVSLENCNFYNDSFRYIAGSSIDISGTTVLRNILVSGGSPLATYTSNVTIENSVFTNPDSINQWGKYKNCVFVNPKGTSGMTGTNMRLVFEHCKIISNIRVWTFNNPTCTMEFKDCELETSGTSAEIIYLSDAKKLSIENCRIDLSTSISTTFISGGGTNKAYVYIKNNEWIGLTTNVKPYDFSWKLPVEPVVYIGNVLNGVGVSTRQIGDTFEDGTTTQRPRKRLIINQSYFDTTLGKPIYVKSIGTNAIYSADISVRSLAYKLGQLVLENGKVHECITAGTTDTSSPTFSTTNATTTVDGTVTWICRGDSAKWVDASGTSV